MADYQLVLVSRWGGTWDVTERVSTLSWSGSIKQVSRQLDVTFTAPNDGRTPELPWDLGNEIRLWVDGATRFRGNLVTREKATGASTLEVSWPPPACR